MDDPGPLPTGEGVGRIRRAVDADRRYLDHLLIATPNPLNGLRVVVDCAHGASSELAPEVYRRAGAEVVVIGGSPDGLNINLGVGSTHLDRCGRRSSEHDADLGIAHDGDADRCLAVAADGSDVDGDVILALLATSLRDRGRLAQDTVVATVMANIGFHQAMARAGIAVRTTAVGDRYVLEEMRAGGLLARRRAVRAHHPGRPRHHRRRAAVRAAPDGRGRGGRPAARRAGVHRARSSRRCCSTCGSATRPPSRRRPRCSQAVAQAEAELAGSGRVLLRPSGTESLVRVMVEARHARAGAGRRRAGRGGRRDRLTGSGRRASGPNDEPRLDGRPTVPLLAGAGSGVSGPSDVRDRLGDVLERERVGLRLLGRLELLGLGALDLVLQLVGQLLGVGQVPDEERGRQHPGDVLHALVRARAGERVGPVACPRRDPGARRR